MSELAQCHYCSQTEEEMRPYGPQGSWVCMDCAFATPERGEETTRIYLALLSAAEAMSDTGMVEIGDVNGPRPILKSEFTGE